MNRYKVVKAQEGWPKKLPYRLGVPGHDTDYGIGEEFEHEFAEADEAANLASGLLEIVPRDYKIVGGSHVFETPPGETITRAIPQGQEALLIEGGHIERVEKPAKKATKKKEEGK